jgi:MSHA biogenesis protein MshO
MRCPDPRRARRRQHGFTLAEAIIVIVITGIVAAAVAVFIRAPVDAYFDTAARAELSDVADTSLRRIVRDVRAALPNSVRVQGTCDGASVCRLEFIPVATGGRYRAEPTDAGTGDILDFTANDGSFDVLGPAVTVPDSAWIVVFNLGIPGADAYAGSTTTAHNRRSATAAASTSNIAISPAVRLLFESPARRFHVVQQPVTYECNPGAGTLTRHWDYGFNATQAAPGGSSALLASGVSRCLFGYAAQAVQQRSGLVTMQLALTRNQETVGMVMQTHVGNVP